MRVTKNDRTISTIGKHIIAHHTLPGGGVGVRIDEAGHPGIVITGLQIVELSLRVKNISTVAQGVHVCQGAGGGENVAVWVVLVFRNHFSLCVNNGHDITLEIGDVVVQGSVMLDREGVTACVIEEIESIGAVGLSQQLTTSIVIGMHCAVDGFTGSQAVGIVGIADGVGAVGGGGKLAAPE